MSTFDVADLLQRVKDYAGRPTTDAVFTDAFWYRRLTEAEQEWKPIIAAHYPNEMWVGPYLMRSISDERFVFGDVCLNGAFDSSTSWTTGANWSIGSGVATAATSSAALTQTPTIALVKGLTYRVRATAVVTSGSFTPTVGGTSGTSVSATASIDQEIIAGSGTTFGFTGAAFVGTLDDVKVELAENPLKLEFIESLTGGILKAGVFTSQSADYVLESGQIRVPRGRSTSFSDGAPYIRMIPPAGVINASYDSTVYPKRARILLVYKALALAANRHGVLGDPSRFEDLMDEAWYGNPERGKIGLQAQLRVADHHGGLVGVMDDGPGNWWTQLE